VAGDRQVLANMTMQDTMEATRIFNEEKARRALAAATGVRLQDAIIGKLYRVTALYRGESQVLEYPGCIGSHDRMSHGVHVGAVAFFQDLAYGSRVGYTTSQLEPGGRSAQWFMVALTEEEEAAARVDFAKQRTLRSF
jgi:hypothetical protein